MTKQVLRSAFLFSLVIALIIGIGVPVYLHFFLDKRAVISIATKELSNRLKRQIIIKDTSISLASGILLKDIKISEAADFSSGIFIETDKLYLKPKLMALFKGKIIIEDIEISNAKISIFRDEKGSWNFEDIVALRSKGPEPLEIEPSQRQSASADMEEKHSALQIKNIKIANSSLSLSDTKKEFPEIKIDGFNLNVSEFSLDDDFDVFCNLDLNARSSKEPENKRKVSPQNALDKDDPLHNFEGNMTFLMNANIGGGNASKMHLKIERFAISTKDYDGEISGTLKDIKNPRADLSVSALFKDFSTRMGSGPLKISGKASGNIKLSRADEPDKISASLNLDAKDLAFSWNNILDKAIGVPLKADLSGDISRNGFDGSVKILAGSSKKASINKIVIKKDTKSAKGKPDKTSYWVYLASASIPLNGLPNIVKPVSGYHTMKGILEFERIKLIKSKYSTDVTVYNAKIKNAEFKNGIDDIGLLMAKLDTLRYTSKSSWWRLDLQGNASGSDVNSRFLLTKKFDARTNIMKITNDHPPKTSGKILAHLGKGAISNIPGLAKTVPFFKFLLTPLDIFEELHKWKIIKIKKDYDFSNIPINSLDSIYSFHSGKMDIEQIDLKSPLADSITKGSVDFPKNHMNLLVYVSLPKDKMRLDIGDIMVNKDGTPYISVKIKGPLKKPKVYPVLDKIKDEHDDTLKHEVDKLKKEGKKLLKKLIR
ncbi:AsmA family protein [Elusimicrobiota bacterium]